MTKKSKTKPGRSNGEAKHVRLYWYIVESWAYRNLSPQARALLVEFMHLYHGANNGELYLSQREAAKALGLKTHGTAAKYLQELIKWGFLKVRTQGAFNNKTGQATSYILTEYEWGPHPATKDFLRIEPRTAEEKAREREITPAHMLQRPHRRKMRPVHWDSEVENSPRTNEFEPPLGSTDQATYSMPSPRADEGAVAALS